MPGQGAHEEVGWKLTSDSCLSLHSGNRAVLLEEPEEICVYTWAVESSVLLPDSWSSSALSQ